MPKTTIHKIIVLLCSFGALAGFLVIGYWQKTEHPRDNFILAQGFSAPYCEEPIPIGQVLDEATELTDAVYQEHQRGSAVNLSSAIAASQGITASLSQSENVCDFTRCFPKLIDGSSNETDNIAPGFTLEFNAYVTKGSISARPPLCVQTGCVGDPCYLDEIDSFLKELEINKQALIASADNIKTLFSVPTVPVTEDTRIKEDDPLNRTPEKVGFLITKQENIKREIDLAGKWTGFCALSALEEKKMKAGKMGNKYPMQCLQSLKNNLYWPKSWSETCPLECKYGLDQDCKDCLAECKGTSVLADINCKIFSQENNEKCGPEESCCGNVCRDNVFAQECVDCLCQGLSKDECSAWLCGGNTHNFVCCHDIPLTTEELMMAYGDGTEISIDNNDVPAPLPVAPEPSAPQGRPFDWEESLRNGLKGDGDQVPYASGNLIELLTCIENKVPSIKDEKTQWWIGSIADSHLINETCKLSDYRAGKLPQCSGRSSVASKCCSHAKFSCHYGGNNCVGSYAFDLSIKGDSPKYKDVMTAACKCGQEKGWQVGVFKETNPPHIHISIKGDSCDCDAKGLRGGNQCTD